MNMHKSLRRQRGATLVMGIIFLTLLMLSVTVAFRMSSSNLKAVGNLQSQAEAEASAEAAIEKLISTDKVFLLPATTTELEDSYGVTVSIAPPVCVKSQAIEVGSSADANPNIYLEGVTLSQDYRETHWDIKATATGAATGAKVEMHQGIKIILPAEPNPCL